MMENTPPEIEKVVTEITDAVMRAFALGVRRGTEQERARFHAYLTGTNAEELPLQQTRRCIYGSVTSMVRHALKDLAAEHVDGMGVESVVNYVNGTLGGNITRDQARTALKIFARQDRQEAVRTARGYYLPGPKLIVR